MKPIITTLLALLLIGSTYLIGYEVHVWGTDMNWWQTTTYLWSLLGSMGAVMGLIFYTVEC